MRFFDIYQIATSMDTKDEFVSTQEDRFYIEYDHRRSPKVIRIENLLCGGTFDLSFEINTRRSQSVDSSNYRFEQFFGEVNKPQIQNTIIQRNRK